MGKVLIRVMVDILLSKLKLWYNIIGLWFWGKYVLAAYTDNTYIIYKNFVNR